MSRAAVFLDRDGVLNAVPPRHAYVRHPDELSLLDGAAEAVRLINEAGWLAVLVSNQRGIARGLMTHDDVARVHGALQRTLALAGARLDGLYYCPHAADACDCRKPSPGLLQTAARELDIALERSWVVGDMPEDLALAARAGCAGAVLVKTGWGAETLQTLTSVRQPAALTVADDVGQAVQWIVREGAARVVGA